MSSTTFDARLHAAFYCGSKKEFRRLLALPPLHGGGAHSGHGGGGGWTGAGSGPRSWSNHSSLAQYGQPQGVHQDRLDINARDSLGRTVLHVIASSPSPASSSSSAAPQGDALDFLRLLLDTLPKSGLQLNAQDAESGWTALHRALYGGHLALARVLLAEDAVDPRIKDWEDLTCWDLYNGTVEGTNPPEGADRGDALFAWGQNRNFTLGTDGDRALPERVQLKRAERRGGSAVREEEESDDGQGGKTKGRKEDLRQFEPVGVREIVMSKLHTAVVTAERSGNVSLCGFGSGGRLGRSVHTQIELTPIPDLPHQITSVALGQDHTLLLTAAGQVLSFGANRFATLGYAIDAPALGSKFSKDPEEAVQTSPRRILGPLKKEVVRGVAASRCSSACFTDDAVWTWGLNNGHLGYDVGGAGGGSGSALQVLPRKVAGITQPVIGLALTDFALCVLLATNEVVCLYRNGSTKVAFPSAAPFFAESAIYRPPQVHRRLKVTKVVASGITFACLTSLGDVFTFALPRPSEVEREASGAGVSLKDRAGLIKPQRTWALRKRFTAVQDVALGSDGSIILCTQSGHVYIRARTKALGNSSSGGGGGGGSAGPAGWSSSKAFKFHRIPYLQRVIKVAANETGAFGAIRLDAVPQPVEVKGFTVGEDLTLLQPHVRRFMEGRKGSFLLDLAGEAAQAAAAAASTAADAQQRGEDADGEPEVDAIRSDLKLAAELLEIADTWAALGGYRPLAGDAGSDCVLVAAGRETPAHAFVLAARCPQLFVASERVRLTHAEERGRPLRIEIAGVKEHLSVLLLLQYLYSDDLPAVWDSRVGSKLQESSLTARKLDLYGIRTELRVLAHELDLPLLAPVLERLTKTPIAPSLSADLARAFAAAQKLSGASSPLRSDVVLELADRRVEAHACVLRSRSAFFSALFDDDDWTRLRLDPRGVLRLEMSHLTWPVMRLVFRYLYEGAGAELFEYHHQDTLDAFLDFVFDVLAAATELLLDQLVLICSAVVLRHVTIFNVCALLDTASFFNADALRRSLQHYIALNMETMLESHYLDSLDADLLADLTTFVHAQQEARLPVSRSNVLVTALMEEHKGWLALQDVPKPAIRTATRPAASAAAVRSPRMSPVDLTPPALRPVRRPTRTTIVSPTGSPALRPSAGPDDDLFTMDEDDDVAGLAAGIAASLAMGGPAPSSAASAAAAGPATTAGTPAKPTWKPRTVEAAKTDLRSIMSEAASSSRTSSAAGPVPRPSIDPTPSLSFKISQKDRKRIQSQPPAPPPRPSGEGGSGSGSPWRTIVPSTTPVSLAPSASSSATHTPFSSSPRRDSAFPAVGALSRSGSSTGPGTAAFPRPPSANASGEVIRPVRAAPSSTPRKVSSDPAWVVPSFASPPPSRPSPTTATSSFAHIQQQQKSDRDVAVVPSKTLAQIQQEEEADRRAAVEEAKFMRWWAEEEKRLAKEAAGASAGQGAVEPGSSSKRGGSKGARGGKKPKGGGAGGAGDTQGPSRGGKVPAVINTSNAPQESCRPSASGQKPRGGKGGKGTPVQPTPPPAVAPAPTPSPRPPLTAFNPAAAAFVPGPR